MVSIITCQPTHHICKKKYFNNYSNCIIFAFQSALKWIQILKLDTAYHAQIKQIKFSLQFLQIVQSVFFQPLQVLMPNNLSSNKPMKIMK